MSLNIVDDFWRGLSLLSRVPAKPVADFSPDLIARSVWCWPLVGLFLAGCSIIPIWFIDRLAGDGLLSCILGVTSMVVLSGAMHEDGFADCADGFGGGLDRARKLEIMRDSRIGTYGVVALVLVFAFRLSILTAAYHHGIFISSLIIMAVFSRATMAPVMRMIKPARDNGLGKNAGRPKWPVIILGVVLASAVTSALCGPLMAVALLFACIFASVLVSWIAHWQIGGYSGDVLGATQIVSEIFCGMAMMGIWQAQSFFVL